MNNLIFFWGILWIYLLNVLKRNRMSAFFFILGGIGFFFIILGLSKPYWVFLLSHIVVMGTSFFWSWTHWVQGNPMHNFLYIFDFRSSISISIDYECSGIIESCAYVSLVLFFPAYSRKEKLLYSLIGLIWIYFTNIIRLSVVIIVVHFLGVKAFYLSHSILGRVVFYISILILYYKIFTYTQVTKNSIINFKNFGKIGDINK